MQCILNNETYHRLLEALLAASAEAHLSEDTDAFKIALGEIGGIWPETVFAGFDGKGEQPAVSVAA